MKDTTRRSFIKKSTLAAGAIPFIGLSQNAWSFVPSTNETTLSINIFSKHLQFLDYRETGRIAKELGFSGVDLTVRPKGHVLPESVKVDLPKAIKEIEKGGSQCKMITTSIKSIHNPFDVDIIKTAAACGVALYRPGWFRFLDDISIEANIEKYKDEIQGLSELNQTVNISGCYQNHAGTYVGASLWEVKHILEKANPEYFGAEYDIRHNMVEGAKSWENSLRLIKDNIKSIVLKDYKWTEVNGKWKPINVPIGEGMVDFKKYFGLLKKYKINVPVTLHMEYDLGGAEKGKREITVDKQVVFNAMKQDLDTVNRLWKEA